MNYLVSILNELSGLFKVVTSNIKSSDVEIDELIQLYKRLLDISYAEWDIKQ